MQTVRTRPARSRACGLPLDQGSRAGGTRATGPTGATRQIQALGGVAADSASPHILNVRTATRRNRAPTRIRRNAKMVIVSLDAGATPRQTWRDHGSARSRSAGGRRWSGSTGEKPARRGTASCVHSNHYGLVGSTTPYRFSHVSLRRFLPATLLAAIRCCDAS